METKGIHSLESMVSVFDEGGQSWNEGLEDAIQVMRDMFRGTRTR